MAPAPPALEYALGHEGELTDRQREVLRLIAKGHTNREIAEMLHISLDGVKWHVREVLSKLGFDSRDEAALFWEWKRRPVGRFSRWVRGLAVAPVAKWAAGSAVALGVVGAVAVGLVIAAVGDDAPTMEAATEPTNSDFYMEARVAVDGEVETTIRWWYRDQHHWRQEIEGWSSHYLVADGQTVWMYDAVINTYDTWDVEGYVSAYPDHAVIPLALFARIGPTGMESIEALRQQMLDRHTDPAAWVTVVGTEEVRGGTATILERGPAWSTAGAPGPQEESGGVVRMWVHDDMSIMRWEVSDEQNAIAEVTMLERDADIPGERFAFSPPDGARDAAQAWGSADSVHDPLVPAYLPEGFRMAGSSFTSQGGVQEDWFAEPSTRKEDIPLRIVRRTSTNGLNSHDMSGTPVDIGTNQAYLFEEGGETRVVWAVDGTLFEVIGDGLPVDEVLRVAASLE